MIWLPPPSFIHLLPFFPSDCVIHSGQWQMAAPPSWFQERASWLQNLRQKHDQVLISPPKFAPTSFKWNKSFILNLIHRLEPDTSNTIRTTKLRKQRIQFYSRATSLGLSFHSWKWMLVAATCLAGAVPEPGWLTTWMTLSGFCIVARRYLVGSIPMSPLFNDFRWWRPREFWSSDALIKVKMETCAQTEWSNKGHNSVRLTASLIIWISLSWFIFSFPLVNLSFSEASILDLSSQKVRCHGNGRNCANQRQTYFSKSWADFSFWNSSSCSEEATS